MYKTLKDAAEILQISPHAVRLKAKRQNWPMSRDNRDRLLVLIPDDQKSTNTAHEKASQNVRPLTTAAALAASNSELRAQLLAEREDRIAERAAWSAAIATATSDAAAARAELARLRSRGLLARILDRS
ncbi:MAG: hypothetical protein ACOVNS_05250 [Erythrobacter sp.]